MVMGDTDSEVGGVVGDADSAVGVWMGDADSAVGIGVALGSAVGVVVAAAVGSAVGVGDVTASGVAVGDDAGLVVAEAPACTTSLNRQAHIPCATCRPAMSTRCYTLSRWLTHRWVTCKSKWQYSGCKCYASCWGWQILCVNQQGTHKCRQ